MTLILLNFIQVKKVSVNWGDHLATPGATLMSVIAERYDDVYTIVLAERSKGCVSGCAAQ